MPASRRMRPTSDAAIFEKREWPCSKIRALTSRCERISAMRASSRGDPCVQIASQAWVVSSAIRLATDAATPSASDASRMKARTRSPREDSSASCSSEKRLWVGAFTRRLIRSPRHPDRAFALAEAQYEARRGIRYRLCAQMPDGEPIGPDGFNKASGATAPQGAITPRDHRQTVGVARHALVLRQLKLLLGLVPALSALTHLFHFRRSLLIQR